MSYHCTISFKQIPAHDVFEFLQRLKKQACEKLEEIAKENFSFSPMMRNYHFQEDFIITDELRKDTEAWARMSVFHYRYFYNKELSILGVYSLPRCMQDIFDLTVYFQNSCDQNYEFEEWSGITFFEEIAKKWKSFSLEEVAKLSGRDDIEHMKDLEKSEPQYYAKSACYEEIWSYFENTLYDDSTALYLSLFGYYDIHAINCFVRHTEKAVLADIPRFEEVAKKRKSCSIEEVAQLIVREGDIEDIRDLEKSEPPCDELNKIKLMVDEIAASDRKVKELNDKIAKLQAELKSAADINGELKSRIKELEAQLSKPLDNANDEEAAAREAYYKRKLHDERKLRDGVCQSINLLINTRGSNSVYYLSEKIENAIKILDDAREIINEE